MVLNFINYPLGQKSINMCILRTNTKLSVFNNSFIGASELFPVVDTVLSAIFLINNDWSCDRITSVHWRELNDLEGNRKTAIDIHTSAQGRTDCHINVSIIHCIVDHARNIARVQSAI